MTIIGTLDRRAVIQALTTQRGPAGGTSEAWNAVDTVWASIKPLKGAEPYDATGKVATADTEIRIRYRADVTPETRLVCEGKTYDVVDVAEMGRRESLKLTCATRRKEQGL